MYVSLWILIVVLLFIVVSLASIIFISCYEKKKVEPKEIKKEVKKEKKPLEIVWELWKNAETPEEAVIYTDCYFALLEYYNDIDRH